LFAREQHPGFRDWPESLMIQFFEKYRETTIVDVDEDKIYGFAVYQQWPEQAHFLCVASIRENAFEWLRSACKNMKQKVTWFDENKMKLVTICQR
jgi:hypothetical protein